MKKILILLLIIQVGKTAAAQELRIHLHNAYVFDDKVDSYFDPNAYYRGTIKGGYLWGASFELAYPDVDMGYEITYRRQDTKAPITYYQNGVKFTNFDLASNYIMLGATRYYRKSKSPLEGFTTAMGGLVLFRLENPDTKRRTNSTKLAWGIKGGGNYWISDKIGIRLQAELLSAVQAVGGGFYFAPGGGSGVGLSTYSTMYQFGFGGGLVFIIPAKGKK